MNVNSKRTVWIFGSVLRPQRKLLENHRPWPHTKSQKPLPLIALLSLPKLANHFECKSKLQGGCNDTQEPCEKVGNVGSNGTCGSFPSTRGEGMPIRYLPPPNYLWWHWLLLNCRKQLTHYLLLSHRMSEKEGFNEVLIEPLKQFAKDSMHLVKKCTKPDRKEFLMITRATSIGFLIMGFIGFFVKLIHIPINNILVGN